MTSCARSACRRHLDAAQAARGASFCSSSCRSSAFRARRLEARTAALDLIETERHAVLVAVLVGDEEAAVAALHDLEEALDASRDLLLR